MIPTVLPFVPGIDVAGTVAEIGSGVTGLELEDPVVAMLPLDRAGATAEYVLAPANALVAAPRTIALSDAAALPLTGLAAWQVLFELAELKHGQTVLVNGAGGAVGGLAVQLAVGAGAKVTAADAEEHAERLESYGAHQTTGFLDFEAGPASVGGPFDIVVNHVRLSPEAAERLVGYVTGGGMAASTAGPLPEQTDRGVRSVNLWVRSDAGQLAALVDRIDAGQLRLHVADRRHMRELGAVHEAAGAGRLAGKTLLTVD